MSYTKQDKLHIVAAVAVLRNDEGKYLVLKRSSNEIAYPNMYTFPGGKKEGNDTVEETLAKELAEETGLVYKPGKILLKDKSFVRPDGQTALALSYLCHVEQPMDVCISTDFTDYKWVDLEELQTLSHVGLEEELIRAEALYKSGIDISLFKTKSIQEVL
ncbi:MAG: NUDIX hydrolase [Candidatus Doudnabacteria bacterium]|nr:NUDIX hydrolase [Candidatus Doudnabacteria bacterium]